MITGNDPSNIKKIIQVPQNVDVNLWQYEHLKQFILEMNLLVTQLKGICTSQTCPKMKGTEEWLFVCAAHKKPQEVFFFNKFYKKYLKKCSAMDYMIHNLDQSTSILQNLKTIGNG